MGGSASKALGKDLIDAAYEGDMAQVQTLLAAKAPVDQADRQGHTALIGACRRAHLTGGALAAPGRQSPRRSC